MRYRIVTALCWLLRHPERVRWYVAGGEHVECPCGTINYTMRGFPLERS